MKRRTAYQSKRDILGAALEVFSMKGYSRATMREVARRAGISVGGIYIYFKDKEALYIGLMRSQMEAFMGHTSALRDKEPLKAMRALIDCYLEVAVKKTRLISMHIKEHDLEFKRPLKLAFLDSQKTLLSDILKRGVKDGVFRRGADRKGAVEAIFLSLRGVILAALSEEIGDSKKYGDSLYSLILNGIKR